LTKKTTITIAILSVSLLASILVNVRLVHVFQKSHDSFWVGMANGLKIENEALQHLVKGENELALEVLKESTVNKAFMLTICATEKCASEEAIEKFKMLP
jgi:hypothetical protein